MASSTAIGIDLGTTHTVAAVYSDDKPVILPNTEGKQLTPSLVFYDPKFSKSTNPSIGEVAENQSLKCPRNFMFDIKRIIGRNFYDIYVQNFIKMEEAKSFPIHIIRSENQGNDELSIQLETDDKSLEITKTPEEICSEILKYIKKSASEALGFEVTEAVISVPAYFSYAQRAATKRAAELAGFHVLKLITEPVAAAVHYTFRKPKTDEHLLMFDLGGGTLDVSVIHVTDEKFTVQAIEGDMFLGGRDFDDDLLEFLMLEIGKKFGNHLINRDTKKGQRLLHRLRKKAKRFKEMLTNVDEYTMMIELDGDNEFEATITREIFEIISDDLFKMIIDKVKQCLQSAKMTTRDVDKVVLVGGSSRIPKVRELLSNLFDHIALSKDINADEAVALGASIHAALIKRDIDQEERYSIVEVAPFSVGVLASYNLMVPFIYKGTPLPVSEMQIMSTTANDQKTVVFEIFEGERMNCKYNNKLGSFTINNLPKGKTGDVEIHVLFRLDENGLLEVSAKESSTGVSNKLQIEMENLTLCHTSMFVSLEENEKLKKDDKMYDEFYRLRLKAETYCQGVFYDLKNANIKLGHVIESECKHFLENMNNYTYTDFDDLKTDFEALCGRAKTLLRHSLRPLDLEQKIVRVLQ